MRSFFRVLLLLIISITCVTAMLKSNQKNSKLITESKILSDPLTDDKGISSDSTYDSSGDDEEKKEEDDEEEKRPNEYYSTQVSHIETAWSAALKLTDRDSSIWRVDRNKNIIISPQCAKSSNLGFHALVKRNKAADSINFEAIQREYYGVDDEDNHENALKYKPKDQDQDDFLSLIEIALNGNVFDDKGNSYCWVPSEIHQRLFSRNSIARIWHSKLFSTDFKYGMAGHNLAFQDMGVGLKDVRTYPESILNSLDQIYDFMYIHNYQPQCSEVINQIRYVEDADELAKKIKNNWGLPKIDDFIDPMPVGKAAAVSNPNRAVMYPKSYKNNLTKAPTSSPAPVAATLSEDDWPSLSSSSSTATTNKSKKPKKNKAN